jgi:predicted anti-sigma-YlaC factor YlaD
MTCEDAREVLSARMDGEAGPDEERAAAAHLTACPACATWSAQAERVSEAVRETPLEMPDRTEAIMAVVNRREVDRAPAASRRRILRVAVGAAAVVQLVLALPALLGGLGLMDSPHAGRELASFDVALAVGFALAAYRPGRARAYLPVAVVLAGCLAVTSAVDIARSSTLPGHELGHLAVAVQALLLWALVRTGQDPDRAGPHRITTARPTA